jgi:OOP family OmpA-OmpF porin
MRKVQRSLVVGVLGLGLAGQAQASEAVKAEASVDAPAASAPVTPANTEAPKESGPPMRRFRPERNMVEVGVFGGVTVFSRTHDLYDPATPKPREAIKRPTPDFGARVGYFPLSFLGVEAEFSALPAKYEGVGSAFIYGLRGHAILQLPLYRVVPFVLGGYGMLGVASASTVAGKDIDAIGHYGGGVKFFINRHLALRLDVRHLIGAQAATEVNAASHVQALLGLSVTLNRAKPKGPKPPVDSDGDGFNDDLDRCPDQKGIAPSGCPDRDSDGDTMLDAVDKCPDVPGVAPDGCPPQDRDRDGFLDDVDACPEQPGVAPDGCPLKDTDGDGILDPDDRCGKEPETRNGFEDADGCPDELPPTVKRFVGVIQGIYFEFNSATIRKKSAPTLDEAARIFREFPDIRVEISGHTDNVGKAEYNTDLSKRRTEAVKQYLIDKGVEGGRIVTRGAGPEEPIADNGTEVGRAKNRRIEFKILFD